MHVSLRRRMFVASGDRLRTFLHAELYNDTCQSSSSIHATFIHNTIKSEPLRPAKTNPLKGFIVDNYNAGERDVLKRAQVFC